MWLCTVQTFQAGGSQLAQMSLLKVAAVSVGAPGGHGQPFDHTGKLWPFLPGRCQCSIVAPIQTVPARNKVLQSRTPLLILLAMAAANPVALLALLAELWRQQAAGGLEEGLHLVQLIIKYVAWFLCTSDMHV